jgi:hypothetical protein
MSIETHRCSKGSCSCCWESGNGRTGKRSPRNTSSLLMPVACSHEPTASIDRTPKSMGPVARLNMTSVGVGDFDLFTAAFSGSFC